jgi:hypothetical protein
VLVVVVVVLGVKRRLRGQCPLRFLVKIQVPPMPVESLFCDHHCLPYPDLLE